MKIGILDFGDITNVSTTTDIIEGVVTYARRAEKLGFSKFWLSEHHPRSLIWSNPITMLSILCTQTQNISIGAGGVLGAFHSPYEIFDHFRQLSLIFPGRIDLGFANGNPAMNIKKLLLNNENIEDICFSSLFVNNLIKTIQLLENPTEEENIIPVEFVQPSKWILSSSCSRLPLALQTGCDVCFSTFHSEIDLSDWKSTIYEFREKFLDRYERYPKLMIAFSGFIDNTQKKARKRYHNHFGVYYKETSNILAGTPTDLERQLNEWKDEFLINEFLFKDMETDNNRRKKTLNLISKQLL